MFVLTTLAYPCLLAALCLGAGLLVDRLSGSALPGAVLPAVGAAGLIGVSQLTTDSATTASATPYVMAAVAAAGSVAGWRRLTGFVRRLPAGGWDLTVIPTAYLLAIAPVLLAGRPTFSAYQVLGDSAFHIMGADYLLHHGRDFSGLDLRNSYGLFVRAYYGTGYPSGADTLFGGSAGLPRLSLLWTFQPFNAFVLALSAGPALVLARRLGLAGGWAALAAVAATVPALVYAYELIGSIKEITALAMILGLGALVAEHRRWLSRAPTPLTAGIPFALLVAAGASALGVGFGAWALASTVLLVVLVAGEIRAGRQRVGRCLGVAAIAAVAVLVAALPTWLDVSSSLQITQGIAATSNAGNLPAPLRLGQVFGTWLIGSYTQVPAGSHLELTYAVIGVTVLAAAFGIVHLARTRAFAVGAWLVLMVLVGVGLMRYGTTWTDAKTLMLTSPVVVLTAWAGVAGLRTSSLRLAAPLLAAALVAGVLASDALQYHTTNLAPTARYDELASLNSRFAGQGPVLFTDFDEYAMYALRSLDVGGPNFAIRPPALGKVVVDQGSKVDLNRVPLTALRAYPLIVTRVDPTTSRPPADYRVVWHGTYYEVWGRQAQAGTVLAKLGLTRTHAASCYRVKRFASAARHADAEIVAASAPRLLAIPIERGRHPASWTQLAVAGLDLSGPGTLRTVLRVPRPGTWHLWLQGEFEAPVQLRIDGRLLTTVGGAYSGDPANPDTLPQIPVHLTAGRHVLALTRPVPDLRPGDGGTTTLRAAFLTRKAHVAQRLHAVSPAHWRTLCGQPAEWLEVVRAGDLRAVVAGRRRPAARIPGSTNGAM